MILLVSFLGTATAQEAKDKDLSNAERFSLKAGTLMTKEFIDIGKVKGAKVQVVYYTDLISKEVSKAVRFEYLYSSGYTSDTKIAVLDEDEMDGLIKSINLILDSVYKDTPLNYKEVSFKSRDGFEAGCFWKKTSWSSYIKLEKYDSDSYVFMNSDDFISLLTVLIQAKSKL
jgi:hypothetical protein